MVSKESLTSIFLANNKKKGHVRALMIICKINLAVNLSNSLQITENVQLSRISKIIRAKLHI